MNGRSLFFDRGLGFPFVCFFFFFSHVTLQRLVNLVCPDSVSRAFAVAFFVLVFGAECERQASTSLLRCNIFISVEVRSADPFVVVVVVVVADLVATGATMTCFFIFLGFGLRASSATDQFRFSLTRRCNNREARVAAA